MFGRSLESELRRVAGAMPAITLTGPRQSGKTTLARAVFPDHEWILLEEPDVRSRALADPRGLLSGARAGVILDEVQKVPDLLSYVMGAIERDPRPGRFVLTGSQNLLLMERISQTLAGRTALLRLLPLTMSELTGRAHLDPARLDAPLREPVAPPDRGPWETLWAGFYPRIHDQRLAPDRWLADYERTYVERDLRDVLRVMDLDAFQRFVRLAAARTGQLLNVSELAADAGINHSTAREWLAALQVGFLVVLLPAHHENFAKRMRKQPKLHFLDTGLACHLLGIRDPATLEHHPLRGAIFESFVVGELVKAFENRGLAAPLYHWRDASGHEIDILLDLGDRLLPVEVKSGMTVPSDAVDALLRWTRLPGNPNQRGVLVHGGSSAFTLRDMTVLPWFLT